MSIAVTGVILPVLSWLSVIAAPWWRGTHLRARWCRSCSLSLQGECQLLFQKERKSVGQPVRWWSLCRRGVEGKFACVLVIPGWEPAVSVALMQQSITFLPVFPYICTHPPHPHPLYPALQLSISPVLKQNPPPVMYHTHSPLFVFSQHIFLVAVFPHTLCFPNLKYVGCRWAHCLLPSTSPPLSLPFCSRGSLRLSSRWRRREAGRRRRWWRRARAREEGGTWQWGDAGREISLSPSLLRGRHWAPETGACGSFTGSGCFLIHWLAMDVRRGQWREGRGRWCYWEAVLLQRQTNKLVRVLNLYFFVCMWISVRRKWLLNGDSAACLFLCLPPRMSLKCRVRVG